MDGNIALLHFSHREYVVFSFWKVGTNLGLVASILVVVLIGVLHDAILGLRVFLDREILLCAFETSSACSDIETLHNEDKSSKSTDSGDLKTKNMIKRQRSSSFIPNYLRHMINRKRLLQAGLYAFQWSLFFTLVLIVCTFNVWLILAAIFGKSVGYLVFIGSPAFEAVKRLPLKN